MTIAETDPRLIYMAFDDVDTASGTCNIRRNCWWAVHPTRGLIFYASKSKTWSGLISARAQCNSDESIAKTIIQDLYPWAEIRHIPLVIQPIDPNDW